MSQMRPFDSGLQTERTLLAWRRTCLTLGVASAVAVRLMAPEFGAVVVTIGLAGIFSAATAYVLASHRYRRAHVSLTETAVLGSGGRSLALLFGLVLLLNAIGLAYVINRATDGPW
jgi:uncharacterized membrane protein YidH (DUF202 family)